MSGCSRALLLAAACVLLVPLASELTAGTVPGALRIAVLALLAFSLWRPAHGLVALTVLAPISPLLLPAARVAPTRLSEAFVLAFLSGWLAHRGLTRREAGEQRLQPAATLFASVVAGSCLVELATLQIATDYPLDFLSRLWRFASRAFLLPSADFPSLTAAALLIEGIGLLLAVQALADRIVIRRLVTTTAAVGVGLALLNITEFVIAATAGTLTGPLRISVHVRDLNAAGSYLVMVFPIALGLAAAGAGVHRLGIGLAAVAVGAAVWLTGSRAAVGIFGGLIMAAAAWGTLRHRLVSSRRLALSLLAGGILLVGAVAVAPQVVVREVTASRALDIRREFLATSFRMIAQAPLFGIGIGQYYPSSRLYMSSTLRAVYPVENAHNNFLQVGAELGLVGLAAFLWMLGAVLARLWRRVRSDLDDPVPAGVFAGLAAFMVTCLTGHPLLVPEIAYPFWIALGAAGSLGVAGPDRTGAAAFSRRRLAMILAALAVLATVPFRVAAKSQGMDFSQVTYGLRPTEHSKAGVEFRRVDGEATFFVRAGISAVELPLALADARPGESTQVEIALDGRPANRVRVEAGDWTRARVIIPPSPADRPFRRLQVRAICPGSGSGQAACPGVNDGRLATTGITVF